LHVTKTGGIDGTESSCEVRRIVSLSSTCSSVSAGVAYGLTKLALTYGLKNRFTAVALLNWNWSFRAAGG
jgi:hypothetical protein